MTDEEPVPVAVVGAGNMGSNHVRVYDELPEAELVEVVEKDPEIAAEIEESYDVDVVDSVEHLTEAEAATVAVPNRLHREVSTHLLDEGLDLLVEKPLAETLEDAEAIVEAAEENGAVLQVGHIERFNPAVELLAEMLEDQDIIAMEAHRLGPFNEQLSEVSVVFDLMIHDIDVIRHLSRGSIDAINSVGSRTKSDELDHVFTQFSIEDGTIASLTASHVTHGKVRTLDVTTPESYINLDYQKQDITIQRRGTEKSTELFDRRGYRNEAITESPYINRVEPLKHELQEFLACARRGDAPKVNGRQGVEAVRTASNVIEGMEMIRED